MSSPDLVETDTGAPVEVDELRERAVVVMSETLGDGVVESHIKPGVDLWIRVEQQAWMDAGLALRDRLGCRAFEFVSAIDWLPSPFGKNEDSPLDPRPQPSTEIVTGYAGGETRFQVIARAMSYTEYFGVTLKVDLPDDDLSLPSWIGVYAGADWHERETHEMFGIDFKGHPNLTHIYLPGEFEGHPLRKTFPLLARHVKPWPGLVDVEPMPSDAGESEDAQ